MKKILSALVVVAVLLVSVNLFAETITPSKKYVTKKVKVGDFKAISTATSIDVIYTQTSGSRDVEIYASDNLIEYIQVGVEGETLVVRFKSPRNNFSISGSHKMEVHVSAPAVNDLKASSSGDIILKNGLKTSGNVSLKSSSSGDIKGGMVSCDDLFTSASSSGDIVLEKLKCENLDVKASSSGDVSIKDIACVNVTASASSSGDVYLAGNCQKADYNSSSSGELKAKDLKAVDVQASASSSGDITCYVTGTLKAKVSSAGDIAYKGNPKHVEYSPKRGVHKID